MLKTRGDAKRRYLPRAKILSARGRSLFGEFCLLAFEQFFDARGRNRRKSIWDLSKGLRMMRLIKHGSWDFPNTVHKNRFVGTTLLAFVVLLKERLLLRRGGSQPEEGICVFTA